MLRILTWEKSMRNLALMASAISVLACYNVTSAFAWGQEGHSIVGELAQHQLTPAAAAAVAQILGQGVSLASVSSWADDYRAANHPETFRWHFVDIPATADARYDPAIARKCRAWATASSRRSTGLRRF